MHVANFHTGSEDPASREGDGREEDESNKGGREKRGKYEMEEKRNQFCRDFGPSTSSSFFFQSVVEMSTKPVSPPCSSSFFSMGMERHSQCWHRSDRRVSMSSSYDSFRR